MLVQVRNIETYLDLKEEHLVCKGKVILIYTNDTVIEPGFIYYNDNYLPNTRELKPYSTWLKSFHTNKWKKILPIVISESEGFDKGDWVYDVEMNEVAQFKNPAGLGFAGELKKILALPEHFSDEDIQLILDKKIINNEEVYVKCMLPILNQEVINNSMGQPGFAHIVLT